MPTTLTSEQIEIIVDKAVCKTFLKMGLDVSEPESVLNHQKDMHHLRTIRERSDTIITKGLLHIVTMLISGVMGAAAITFMNGGYHG